MRSKSGSENPFHHVSSCGAGPCACRVSIAGALWNGASWATGRWYLGPTVHPDIATMPMVVPTARSQERRKGDDCGNGEFMNEDYDYYSILVNPMRVA